MGSRVENAVGRNRAAPGRPRGRRVASAPTSGRRPCTLFLRSWHRSDTASCVAFFVGGFPRVGGARTVRSGLAADRPPARRGRGAGARTRLRRRDRPAALRSRAGAVAGEPGGGGRAPARARLQRLRDRLRGPLLDGLRLRRARSASSRASSGIVLSVHAPIAGFMGHAERGKKLNMAVGMLDHSAGIAQRRRRRARRLPPRLPARPHARGGDRLGLRAARRAPRAARRRRTARCRSGSR